MILTNTHNKECILMINKVLLSMCFYVNLIFFCISVHVRCFGCTSSLVSVGDFVWFNVHSCPLLAGEGGFSIATNDNMNISWYGPEGCLKWDVQHLSKLSCNI